MFAVKGIQLPLVADADYFAGPFPAQSFIFADLFRRAPAKQNPAQKFGVDFFRAAFSHGVPGLAVIPREAENHPIKTGPPPEIHKDDLVRFLQAAGVPQIGVVSIYDPAVMGIQKRLHLRQFILPGTFHPAGGKLDPVQVQYRHTVCPPQRCRQCGFAAAAVTDNADLHDGPAFPLPKNDTAPNCGVD